MTERASTAPGWRTPMGAELERYDPIAEPWEAGLFDAES
jgi:hypothetical protein